MVDYKAPTPGKKQLILMRREITDTINQNKSIIITAPKDSWQGYKGGDKHKSPREMWLEANETLYRLTAMEQGYDTKVKKGKGKIELTFKYARERSNFAP